MTKEEARSSVMGAISMTEEPKKNHWYEMYELECSKTKDLEKHIEKAKELLKKLRYYIPHHPEWDADYEDEEHLRNEVEQFLKE